MSPDNDRADPARPGVLRRIGRAAASPWRSLRIGERVATLRRELDELRSGDRRAASRVRLDEGGAFDLDAMAFLHGQGRRTFEETLASRARSTARNAWIFLGLGVMFFAAWLYRLVTMTWTELITPSSGSPAIRAVLQLPQPSIRCASVDARRRSFRLCSLADALQKP